MNSRELMSSNHQQSVGLSLDCRDRQTSGSETETESDFSNDDDDLQVVTRESVIASLSASNALFKAGLGPQASPHASLHEKTEAFAAAHVLAAQASFGLTKELVELKASTDHHAANVTFNKTPGAVATYLEEGQRTPDAAECDTSSTHSVTSSSWDGESQSPQSHRLSSYVSSAHDICEARGSPHESIPSNPTLTFPISSTRSTRQSTEPHRSPSGSQGGDAASQSSLRESERSSNQGLNDPFTPNLSSNVLGLAKPLTPDVAQGTLSNSLPMLATATPYQRASPTGNDDSKQHVHQASQSTAGPANRGSGEIKREYMCADAGCLSTAQGAAASAHVQGANNNVPVMAQSHAPPPAVVRGSQLGTGPRDSQVVDEVPHCRGICPLDVVCSDTPTDPTVEVAPRDQGPRDPAVHQDFERSPGVPRSPGDHEGNDPLEPLREGDLSERSQRQGHAVTCGHERSANGPAVGERLRTGDVDVQCLAGRECLSQQTQSQRESETGIVVLAREGAPSPETGTREPSRTQSRGTETLQRQIGYEQEEQDSLACSTSESETSLARLEEARACTAVRPPMFTQEWQLWLHEEIPGEWACALL